MPLVRSSAALLAVLTAEVAGSGTASAAAPVDHCDFERLDSKIVASSQVFASTRPLVLTGATEGWRANEAWKDAHIFENNYGDAPGYSRDHDQLELRDVDQTVSEYLARKAVNNTASGLGSSAAFFVNNYEDSQLLDRIQRDFEAPAALKNIGAFHLFSLEHSFTGVTFHRHEAAWQALVAGKKRWYLASPSVGAVPQHSPCSFEIDGPPPVAEVCTLSAGEAIFVPSGWWHATCTLSKEPSIAIGGVEQLGNWPPTLLAARAGDLNSLLAGGHNVDEVRLPPGRGIFVGGESPLFVAAAFGHEALVSALLERKASPDLARRDGRTPLQEAARRGSIPMLKLLHAAGADTNAGDASGSQALHHAVSERGHAAAVEWLLEQRASVNARRDDGRSALHVACHGHRNPVPVLRTLLQKGHAAPAARDGDEATPLLHCAEKGHDKGVALLMRFGGADAVQARDKNSASALDRAMLGRGDGNVVARLLGAGLRAEDKTVVAAARMGELSALRHLATAIEDVPPTAFFEAARAGHSAAVEVLTGEFGIKVDELEKEGGASAAHLGALAGHLGVLRSLANAKSDLGVLADTDGLTAMHYAALAGSHNVSFPRRKAVMELLAGTAPSLWTQTSSSQLAPLHLAAAAGDHELATWLLEKRAVDPAAKDEKGLSALDMARQASHAAVVEVLSATGGKSEL